MKTYRVMIYSELFGKEEFELGLEWKARHFSRENYRMIITDLFDLACEGCENNHLTAFVECDGKRFLVIKSDTTVDCATITAYLTMARSGEEFQSLRTMSIAD